jgi:hypothetical protein
VRLPQSSEAASRARLFFGQSLLETGADRFVRERVAALDLRQTLFDFSDEPLVLIDQAFNRFTRAKASASQPRWSAIRASLACRSGERFTSIRVTSSER